MHRGEPTIVRPAGGQIAEVDQQRPGRRRDGEPTAVGPQDLEAWHRIGPQDRDDPVVGVGTHPHLALADLDPDGDVVVVHPQHVDRMVGERLEVPAWKAERRGENRRHRSGHATRAGHPGQDAVSVSDAARTVGPDVLGVDLGIEGEVREVRDGGADVERLEQVIGRHDSEAVAQPLGPRRRVAPVDRRPRRHRPPLLVDRQGEEPVDRAGQPVDHRGRDAVSDDLHEPDGPTGIIDRGGDLGIRRADQRHPKPTRRRSARVAVRFPAARRSCRPPGDRR